MVEQLALGGHVGQIGRGSLEKTSAAEGGQFVAEYRRHECLLHPVIVYIYAENVAKSKSPAENESAGEVALRRLLEDFLLITACIECGQLGLAGRPFRPQEPLRLISLGAAADKVGATADAASAVRIG
jgi:hypothetical protein